VLKKVDPANSSASQVAITYYAGTLVAEQVAGGLEPLSASM